MTARPGALRLTAYRQTCLPRGPSRLLISATAASDRHVPGRLTLHRLPASAKCSRTERCLTRGPPRSSRKAALSGLRSSVVETPPGPAEPRGHGGKDARTCRPAMYRPGGGRNSELAAEYPDAFTMLVLLLLHDFPIRGDFTGFRVQVPRTRQIPMVCCFRACGIVARARPAAAAGDVP
jgi:hypothetical protein